MTEPTQAPEMGNNPPAGQPQQTHEFTEFKVTGDFQEIAAYLSNIRTPGIFDTRMPFVILPQSLKVHDIEQHMPVPSRTRKRLTFTEAQSFVDYYKAFEVGNDPRLFVASKPDGMEILCVFDYGRAGVAPISTTDGNVPGQPERPLWGDHVTKLAMKYHEDYAMLKASEAKWMKNTDFALFIEQYSYLFMEPDAASMLELAQELKGTRTAAWQTGKRLSNSQTSLQYIETIEAKSVRGEVTVPEYLTLFAPIYEGYPPQKLKAAFSWNINPDNHRVEFLFRLLTRQAEREATDLVKTSVAELTGKRLYAVDDFDGISVMTRQF
jgi:uncharacterized protein YfdQ (DUF2303 family)